MWDETEVDNLGFIPPLYYPKDGPKTNKVDGEDKSKNLRSKYASALTCIMIHDLPHLAKTKVVDFLEPYAKKNLRYDPEKGRKGKKKKKV